MSKLYSIMEETLAISWHQFACKQEVMYPVTDIIIDFLFTPPYELPMVRSLTWSTPTVSLKYLLYYKQSGASSMSENTHPVVNVVEQTYCFGYRCFYLPSLLDTQLHITFL